MTAETVADAFILCGITMVIVFGGVWRDGAPRSKPLALTGAILSLSATLFNFWLHHFAS